jgi:hypothetical protein
MTELLLTVGLSLAIGQEQPAPVVVTVHPETKQIAGGDPLLLKVVIANRSRAALPFNPPLSTRSGNLWLEVRALGQQEFTRLPLTTNSPPDRPTDRAFEAAAEFVSYERLFRYRVRDKLVPVFSAEGGWVIRASVLVGRRYYQSDPVEVKVVRPPVGSERALAACEAELHHRLSHPTVLPEREDLATLEASLPLLADTNAGSAIRRLVKLGGVYLSRSVEDRRTGESEWADLRAKASPVQQEYMDLLLAIAYLKCKDYPSVRKQLKMISAASSLHDDVRYTLGLRDPDR